MMGLGFGLAIEKRPSGGAAPTPTPPVNTLAPAISGTPIVNNNLSVSTGTWTGIPAPTFTYQWKNDGVNIGGAVASLYTLTTSDAPHTLNCIVVGTNTSGTVTATSNSVAVTKTTLSYTPVTTGTQGTLYTGATPSTSGGTPGYLYSITAGTVPTGTTLVPSTGVISGTPTSAAAFTGIVLTVTDANGITDASTPFTITIASNSPGSTSSFPGTLLGGN